MALAGALSGQLRRERAGVGHAVLQPRRCGDGQQRRVGGGQHGDDRDQVSALRTDCVAITSASGCSDAPSAAAPRTLTAASATATYSRSRPPER